jgi:xylulokinase
MIIATFDFGTTAVKCAVLNEKNEILFSDKKDITTYNNAGTIEQSPEQWYTIFCELLAEYSARSSVDAVICSGQMQDLIFLGTDNKAVRNAILYNDQRAGAYADIIPSDIILKTTVDMNGSIPLPKLYWVQDNEFETFTKTKKILISAKDYIIAQLTGIAASDVVSLSTSGMMDIREKKFVPCPGIPADILPGIYYSDDVVGTVTGRAALETGLRIGVKVFAGSGDAGATTLASGITEENEININLGTSGWVAGISGAPRTGVFNLCAVNRDRYINVIPVLNAASVHKWISTLVFDGDSKKYDRMEDLLRENKTYDTTLLCLPYLVGERFPVSDSEIRGCFLGLNPSTSLADMSLGALEGVAYSLKQGLEKLAITPKRLSLIGGGAIDPVWDQIFANVFETEVTVFKESEYLPAMALASSVLLHEGFISCYREFITTILARKGRKVFLPEQERLAAYRRKFSRFKELYPAIRPLFSS